MVKSTMVDEFETDDKAITVKSQDSTRAFTLYITLAFSLRIGRADKLIEIQSLCTDLSSSRMPVTIVVFRIKWSISTNSADHPIPINSYLETSHVDTTIVSTTNFRTL